MQVRQRVAVFSQNSVDFITPYHVQHLGQNSSNKIYMDRYLHMPNKKQLLDKTLEAITVLSDLATLLKGSGVKKLTLIKSLDEGVGGSSDTDNLTLLAQKDGSNNL